MAENWYWNRLKYFAPFWHGTLTGLCVGQKWKEHNLQLLTTHFSRGSVSHFFVISNCGCKSSVAMWLLSGRSHSRWQNSKLRPQRENKLKSWLYENRNRVTLQSLQQTTNMLTLFSVCGADIPNLHICWIYHSCNVAWWQNLGEDRKGVLHSRFLLTGKKDWGS